MVWFLFCPAYFADVINYTKIYIKKKLKQKYFFYLLKRWTLRFCYKCWSASRCLLDSIKRSWWVRNTSGAAISYTQICQRTIPTFISSPNIWCWYTTGCGKSFSIYLLFFLLFNYIEKTKWMYWLKSQSIIFKSVR